MAKSLLLLFLLLTLVTFTSISPTKAQQQNQEQEATTTTTTVAVPPLPSHGQQGSFPPKPQPPLPSHNNHNHHHHNHTGHRNHTAHPPMPHPPMAHAPMMPPKKAPLPHPPIMPPHPGHSPMPRSFVAVQGVVYCKSCKYPGVDTLLGASPASGVTVELACNNTKYTIRAKGTTDKNGYFWIEAPRTITNYGAHKCKVYLVSSPNLTCNKPSSLHGGAYGAILRPEKPFEVNKLPYFLFTVGPLAFEPKCPR